MAKGMYIKLNHDEIEKLLGAQPANIAEEIAHEVANSANAIDHMPATQQYTVSKNKGRKGGRPYFVVAADNRLARRKNNKHNTLVRCLMKHKR